MIYWFILMHITVISTLKQNTQMCENVPAALDIQIIRNIKLCGCSDLLKMNAKLLGAHQGGRSRFKGTSGQEQKKKKSGCQVEVKTRNWGSASDFSQKMKGPRREMGARDGSSVSLQQHNGTLGRRGSRGVPLPLPITVPFKATQHLFPPIKTNNLFCRKSRQLLSAGAEACWMACNCGPEVLSLVYFLQCSGLDFFLSFFFSPMVLSALCALRG